MPSLPKASLSKYRRIEQAIRGLIADEGLRSGDRIPSERELCRRHGVAPGTLQKALGHLVSQGLLVRRHGSGTYVQDPAAAPANGSRDDNANTVQATVNEYAVPFVRHTKTLALRVCSGAPHHLRFWQESIKAFEDAHPFVCVGLSVASPDARSGRPDDEPGDLFECGQVVPDIQDRVPLTDLSALSGLVVRARAMASTPCLAPIHLAIPYLAWNPVALANLKLPPPQVESFDATIEFLRRTRDRIEGTPANVPAVCRVSPAQFLGAAMQDLVSRIREGGAESEWRSLTPVVARAIELKELLIRDRRPADIPVPDSFDAGTTPLTLAWNTALMLRRGNRELPDWQATPFLAADDTIPCVGLGVGIRRDTPYPVECLRFIEHLQSDAEQRRLAAHGMTPIATDSETGPFTPVVEGADPRLRRLARQVRPLRLAGRIDHDLSESVIDLELYRATSASRYLARVAALGRDYLRFASPRDATLRPGPTSNR